MIKEKQSLSKNASLVISIYMSKEKSKTNREKILRRPARSMTIIYR